MVDASTQAKSQLMDSIQRERAALESTLAPLNDDQLAQPGHEGWAVKDHLAHVAGWERILIATINGGTGIEVAGLTEDFEWDMDEFNRVLFELWRDRSVAEVKAEFASAHEDLLATLEPLDDQALRSRGKGQEADDPRPLSEKIRGDTWGHYPEHRGWIQELLSRLKAQPT